MDALDEEPEVEITYFKPDERKAGGAYVTATLSLIHILSVLFHLLCLRFLLRSALMTFHWSF